MNAMYVYKILAVCICLLTTNPSISQPPSPGSNITRPYLDKFEGTWKWVSGNSEVIIQLKKIYYYYIDWQIREDVIMGSHKYIQNGVLIEDYLPEFANINATSRSSVFLWANLDGSETNKLSGSIKDISKHKMPELSIEFVPGTTPSLIWHLQAGEGPIVYPTLAGVTLPKDLILVKQ